MMNRNPFTPKHIIDEYSFDPPPNCPASKITWYCGSNDEDFWFYDRKWRYEIFRKYPNRYSIELANIYLETYETESRFHANRVLSLWDETLSAINFKLASNEEALKKHAKEIATKCRYFACHLDYSRTRLRLLRLITKEQKIDLPNKSETGIAKRLSDENWWRRNLRKKHRCGLEEAAIALNLVNKRKSIYISNESFNCFSFQKERNKRLLKKLVAKNELDQEFTLDELSQLSNSNPRIRRSELMVRIAGIERFAKENNHVGVFITITCPSRMHAALSKSGNRNPNYDKTTPKESQKYLNSNWQRIRAKFNRDGINPYGIRVAEPHHDGTPHWHLLIFIDPSELETVCRTIKQYALADSSNEPGAELRRVTTKAIDWKRGSATGYIAKYVSKNIDGFGIEKDEYGNEANSASKRFTAWASTWGIRQFQFFGVPPVSQWRELRRMSAETLPAGILQDCCRAADSGDWFTYMIKMGGIAIKKTLLPLQILKVWSDELGKYEEPLGYVTRGIEFDGVSFISRIHTWTIELVRGEASGRKVLDHGEESPGKRSGAALPVADRQGSPALARRIGVPMSRSYRPLEYCQ